MDTPKYVDFNRNFITHTSTYKGSLIYTEKMMNKVTLGLVSTRKLPPNWA